MRTDRLLPFSGVAFVALLLVSITLAGATPDPASSPQEVIAFYGEHPNRKRAATFALWMSAPFLLLFAASVAGPVDPSRGSRIVWRHLLLGGSVLASAVIMFAVLTHLSLVDATDNAAEPQALQALNVLDTYVIYALMPAFGVMMLGAAGWLLGRDQVPRWLGWSALVLGVWLFIPFIALLGLLLSWVWILGTSIALYRAGRAVGNDRAEPDDITES